MRRNGGGRGGRRPQKHDPRDAGSAQPSDGVGSGPAKDLKVPHPETPWTCNDWRQWDKDNGRVLWMGSIQVRVTDVASDVVYVAVAALAVFTLLCSLIGHTWLDREVSCGIYNDGIFLFVVLNGSYLLCSELVVYKQYRQYGATVQHHSILRYHWVLCLHARIAKSSPPFLPMPTYTRWIYAFRKPGRRK